MFDLDQEFAKWRRAMVRRLPFHREDIDELESHLRDSVRAQMQSGSAPELALAEALKQLGDLDAIAGEYRKLPRHAVWRWWPARIVLGVWIAINLLPVWIIVSRFMMGKGDTLLHTHVITITLAYTAVLSVGALSVWSILSRALTGWSPPEREVFGHVMRYATIASLTLTVMGLVLGMQWRHLRHGIYWSWDPREIGIVVMVAWHVLTLSLATRGTDERLCMLLGLMSNLIVALCWFGVQFMGDQAHITRFPSFIGVSCAVLISLFVLALQPAGCLRFRRAM